MVPEAREVAHMNHSTLPGGSSYGGLYGVGLKRWDYAAASARCPAGLVEVLPVSCLDQAAKLARNYRGSSRINMLKSRTSPISSSEYVEVELTTAGLVRDMPKSVSVPFYDAGVTRQTISAAAAGAAVPTQSWPTSSSAADRQFDDMAFLEHHAVLEPVTNRYAWNDAWST